MKVYVTLSAIILSGCTPQTKFHYYSPSSLTEHKTLINKEQTVAFCDKTGKAFRLTKPVIQNQKLCGDLILSEMPFTMKWGDELQCIAMKDMAAIGLPYTSKTLGLKFKTIVLKNCPLDTKHPEL